MRERKVSDQKGKGRREEGRKAERKKQGGGMGWIEREKETSRMKEMT